jgi:hypothetical protein
MNGMLAGAERTTNEIDSTDDGSVDSFMHDSKNRIDLTSTVLTGMYRNTYIGFLFLKCTP